MCKLISLYKACAGQQCIIMIAVPFYHSMSMNDDRQLECWSGTVGRTKKYCGSFFLTLLRPVPTVIPLPSADV